MKPVGGVGDGSFALEDERASAASTASTRRSRPEKTALEAIIVFAFVFGVLMLVGILLGGGVLALLAAVGDIGFYVVLSAWRC